MTRTDETIDATGNGSAPPPVDYKDEPAFKKLPPSEQWRRMAALGDIRGLLDELDLAMPGMINISEFGQHLNKAVDILARKNSSAFGEFLHADLLATAGKLALHARFIVDQQLKQQFENRQGRGDWSATSEFAALSAKLLSLHAHVAKLEQIAAVTQRVHERTRKLKLANDKAEAKKKRPRQPGRRKRLSTPRQQPAATTSRLGGELT